MLETLLNYSSLTVDEQDKICYTPTYASFLFVCPGFLEKMDDCDKISMEKFATIANKNIVKDLKRLSYYNEKRLYTPMVLSIYYRQTIVVLAIISLLVFFFLGT